MPVLWYCDACGVETSALTNQSRRYGWNYKNLCGGCSKQMDDAALEVFEAIKRGERPNRCGISARIREALG